MCICIYIYIYVHSSSLLKGTFLLYWNHYILTGSLTNIILQNILLYPLHSCGYLKKISNVATDEGNSRNKT